MKTKTIISILAAGLALIACAQKPAVEENAEQQPTEKEALDKYMSEAPIAFEKPGKAMKDSVAYLLGINFGSFIKGYDFGDDLSYAQIKKGMVDFLNAKGDQRSPEFLEQFKISPEAMNDLFGRYLEQRRLFSSMESQDKEAKFFEKNKKKAGVEVTESGLQYIIIEDGDKECIAAAQDTVKVEYKGTLTDGTVFDESPAGEPVEFCLNNVISGWTEGLQLIGKGGKIKLFIPSDLGYGSRGTQGIPPYSTLIFDVTLVDVMKAAIPETEEAAEEPAE